MKYKHLLNLIPSVAILAVGFPIYHRWQRSQVPSQLDYENAKVSVPPSQLNGVMPPSEHWQVVSVTDGDTLTVGSRGKKEKLRLCGIDAPEVPHGSKPGQPFGAEATEKLRSLVGGVGNEVIVMPIEKDRYGRTVAEVFVKNPNSQGEMFVNEELVVAGMAYHYSRYSGSCANQSAVERGEVIAKDKKVGVWSQANLVKP